MGKIVNRNNISSWLLCLISLIISGVSMNYLPDKIPVHFSTNGTADSYGSKFTLFLIPVVILVLIVIAELKKDTNKSSKPSSRYYYQIIFFVNAIIIAFEIYTIATACELELTDINNFVLVILGLLVMTFGNMMPKFGHNFAIGIRTKWTLADEHIWYRTHRLCAKIWFAGGALLVAAAFMKDAMRIGVIAVLVVIMVLVPILYSKAEYEKNNK